MMKKMIAKTIKSILIACFYYILQIGVYCFFTFIIALALLYRNSFSRALAKANEMMNLNHNLVYILTSLSALFLLLLLLKEKRVVLCESLKNSKAPFKTILWTVCLGGSASIITNIILNFLPQVDDSVVENGANKLEMLIYGLGVVLVAVVVEEIIFREIVFKGLLLVMPLPMALLISSLIFAISHGNLIQFIYTFLMGGLFAYLLYIQKSVLYSIIAHASFNFIAFLMMLINELSVKVGIGMVISGMILFYISIRKIIACDAHKSYVRRSAQ